jgi:hypothetical protein
MQRIAKTRERGRRGQNDQTTKETRRGCKTAITYFTLCSYRQIKNHIQRTTSLHQPAPAPLQPTITTLQHTPPLRQHRILPLRPCIRLLELQVLLTVASRHTPRLPIPALQPSSTKIFYQPRHRTDDRTKEAQFLFLRRRRPMRVRLAMHMRMRMPMSMSIDARLCARARARYAALPGLHEQVVALGVDEPVDHELLSLWAAAAAAGEEVRRGRVNGEGEEVGGLREVRHEPAVEEEVDEDEDVHEEDEQQDEHPAHGHLVAAPRAVLLRLHRRVEVLRLRVFEVWRCVVLQRG